ncbi:MAG: PEP-CTERM sorting domain-containing protein [Scytonema sp. RU_4_4]|nr:PEP-CTERM sorting domain-containing protein [Scytonema sp. RU_4_4]
MISASHASYVVAMYLNNFSLRFESYPFICKLLMLLTLVTSVVISGSAPAQAAKFNFSYAPGTSLEQILGFEMAGSVWSNYLADNVTVNIHVEMTDQLPQGVIGGALPGIQANQRYEIWRNQLASDRKSADDQFVFNNQQNDADKFTALIDGYKIDNNYELKMTRANAKALGMLNGNDTALDGYVLMKKQPAQSVAWNYDVLSNNVPSGTLDFLSVGIHELAHHLGFISGIDKAGWLTQKTQYDATHQSDFYATLIGKLDHATPLDMFRFSSESVKQASTSDSWIDMSVGGNSFFSTDGGKTMLGNFSTGENSSLGGDGNQASHWKQNSALGIMEPVIGTGERRSILTLDQRVMDVIGWDLQQGGTDLASLQSQAKARLAQRLGKTVEWLDANPIEAALLLTQDRTLDVQKMIKDSKVYDWRGGSGSGWWQDGLWQHFLWQELPSLTSDS